MRTVQGSPETWQLVLAGAPTRLLCLHHLHDVIVTLPCASV
jgi:hypothetical protein